MVDPNRRTGRTTKVILKALIDLVDNHEAIVQDHEYYEPRELGDF